MFQKLHYRNIWLAVGSLLLLLIAFGSLVPVPRADFQNGDKLAHVFLYFILMSWFAQVIIPRYHFYLVLIISSFGLLLEVAQMVTGYRMFEWGDVLANSIGAMFGWAAMHTLIGQTIAAMDKTFSYRIK